jgi:hypothetical protein
MRVVWGISKMRILGIVALCAALAGCASSGTKFEWDNASKVTVGMTEADLVATMGGRPNAVTTRGNVQGWTWIYVSANPLEVGTRRVSFGLTDGRVTAVPNLSAFTAPASDAAPPPAAKQGGI